MLQDGIKELTALAHQARGITVETVEAPAGAVGVPEKVNFAIKHGTTPEFISLKPMLEAWRTKPERRRGTASITTLESFIALTNRHKTAHSAIFAVTDWRKPALLCVVDYHTTTGEADNMAHRISYTFPLSEEWKAWIDKDTEPMGQADFASHIEDHIADLATPSGEDKTRLESLFGTKIATPAELMQLSRGLQINVDSAVRNIQNLQSGEANIAFEETHKGSDGKPIKVPGLFMLSIAPFFMGHPATVPVRLRYRVKEGKVIWFYQIYRPDYYVTDRVLADLAQAAQKTDLPYFEGEPEG